MKVDNKYSSSLEYLGTISPLGCGDNLSTSGLMQLFRKLWGDIEEDIEGEGLLISISSLSDEGGGKLQPGKIVKKLIKDLGKNVHFTDS